MYKKFYKISAKKFKNFKINLGNFAERAKKREK